MGLLTMDCGFCPWLGWDCPPKMPWFWMDETRLGWSPIEDKGSVGVARAELLLPFVEPIPPPDEMRCCRWNSIWGSFYNKREGEEGYFIENESRTFLETKRNILHYCIETLSIIRIINQKKLEYLFGCKRSIPERRPSSSSSSSSGSASTSSRTTLLLLRYAVHAKGLKSSHILFVLFYKW